MLHSISKTSQFFGILLAATIGYFIFWALDYIQYAHSLLLLLAIGFGIFMAFNIGGNDVANSFGTSIGSGTLSIRQALIIAAIFEVSGAVIAGGAVTKTIRKGIVDLSSITVDPLHFVFIMMAALLAAALWLLIATRKGWPVSTTHSIIGGIVGSSLTLGLLICSHTHVSALNLVQWPKIGQIAISWVLSPLLGGIISYFFFHQIKKHILEYNNSVEIKIKMIKHEKKVYKQEHKESLTFMEEEELIEYTNLLHQDAKLFKKKQYENLTTEFYLQIHRFNTQRKEIPATKALETWVPLISAFGGVIITAMLLLKGFKHLDLGFTTFHHYLIMSMVGAVIWLATYRLAKTLKKAEIKKATFMMFSWMQVFTASAFAFSHGSNDIANAIGPFAAILDVLKTGSVNATASIPPIAMISFGIALVAGLWFIGKKVIQTVGHNLAQMHPASGFSAELAAASVVMLASILGLPVSSTHILIGAVLGIGLVNKNANWNIMKPIAMAWVITLPMAAGLSAVIFMILYGLF